MTSSLLAGSISAVAGLFVFLVVHHVWIAPIWFIAPAGAAIALVGGAGIGWSYSCVRAGLPAGPLAALVVFAMVLAMLLPGIALSYSHGPLFDLATARVPKGQGTAVVARFVLELVVPAILVGAFAGWFLGRSPRAAIATAFAGVAWALGPGHNIPMFGTHPASFKGHAIVLIVAAVTSVTLVATDAALDSR